MIPEIGWKDMTTAPTDGTPIMARYHPRDVIRDRFNIEIWSVHPVQWLCDERGKNWQWSSPYRMGSGAYALGWMTFTEFQAAQAAQRPAAQLVEFDL